MIDKKQAAAFLKDYYLGRYQKEKTSRDGSIIFYINPGDEKEILGDGNTYRLDRTVMSSSVTDEIRESLNINKTKTMKEAIKFVNAKDTDCLKTDADIDTIKEYVCNQTLQWLPIELEYRPCDMLAIRNILGFPFRELVLNNREIALVDFSNKSHCKFVDTIFIKCKFGDISGSFVNCKFIDCDFTLSQLSSLSIDDSSFIGCNFTLSIFVFTKINNTVFEKCIFPFSKSINSETVGVSLRGCNLASSSCFKHSEVDMDCLTGVSWIDINYDKFSKRYEDDFAKTKDRILQA